MLHAVAYAPEDALGGNFLNTPWESVQTAFRVSTFSLKELAVAVAPLMTEGGSIVALDFDNRTGLAHLRLDGGVQGGAGGHGALPRARPGPRGASA